MLRCRYCQNELGKCKMDSRGLCIKDSRSTGREKKRTRKEKTSDKRAGN